MATERKKGYKKYDTAKICPFARGNDVNICLREHCMWFVPQANSCSVYLISLHLFRLTMRNNNEQEVE
jgi:hypothetical protein